MDGARRRLDDLLRVADPAWPLVQEWLATATNPFEVVPAVRRRGARALVGLQVSAGSVLGAVALHMGGIEVEHGWLRVLGSGGAGWKQDLAAWNGLVEGAEPRLAGGLVVAHDAVGGFFAVDGGGLGGEVGKVSYFAPDRLSWEETGLSYGNFVHWVLHGDLAAYYADLRWPGWEQETAALSPDFGFSVYPPLWVSGADGARTAVADRSRRRVPIVELWELQQHFRRRIDGVPDGAQIDLTVTDG